MRGTFSLDIIKLYRAARAENIRKGEVELEN